MSKNAGTLLWNRQRINIPAPPEIGVYVPLDVDTGLTQPNRGLTASSATEPGLAARTQVIPMAPTVAWTFITHGEPYLDPATDTIHVVFSNADSNDAEVNVLFWDPHTMVGPGAADDYNP